MKIKNIKIIFIGLLLLGFLGIFKNASADFEDEQNTRINNLKSHCLATGALDKTCYIIPHAYDQDGSQNTWIISGTNWGIMPSYSLSGDYFGATTSACGCWLDSTTLADGSPIDFCKNVSIETFCKSVSSCNGDINCIKSLGKTYDSKMDDYKKSVQDKLISNSNLNADKVDTVITNGSCNGDLACISKLIDSLAQNPDYNASATSTTIGTIDPNSDPTVQAVKNKQQGPSVKVSFTDMDGLKTGAKVTATAVPGGFKDVDNNNLYFTWYIKHNDPQSGLDCDLADSLSDKNEKCDLDGDKKITENDWKIAATRTIIRGNFDLSSANYSVAPSGFSDGAAGTKADPGVDSDKAWIKTIDHDASNDASAPDCYVQDGDSGNFYELRDSKVDFSQACPSGMHLAYVQNQTTSCDVSDNSTTPATITTVPGLNYCQANNNTITDKWLSDNFGCKVDVSSFKTAIDVKNNSDNSKTAVCVYDDGSSFDLALNNPNTPTLFKKCAEEDSACLDAENKNICSKETLKSTGGSLYFGDKNNSLNRCSSYASTVGAANQPTCGFVRGDNYCKHLFPYFPKGVDEITASNGAKISKDVFRDFKNGDGSFSFAEKEFWGADPNSKMTNGTNLDEAAVIGLGVDQFTWNYQPGDEVGVAVEGDSMLATEHTDNSYKRMWAFSKGTCSALNDIQNKDKDVVGFYAEGNTSTATSSDGQQVSVFSGAKILTTNLDLDDCLEENLMDPSDYDQNKSELSLIATPKNPLNDENGKGDDVTVTASISQQDDYSNIYYDWKVEESSDGAATPSDTTVWNDITSDMLSKYASIADGANQGFSKTEFTFNLNLPNSFIESKMAKNTIAGYEKYGIFYLRVKAKVNVSLGVGQTQVLSANTIIKVVQQQNEMLIYPVTADTSGKLSLNEGSKSIPTELSSAECDDSACYVTKNEVVGVKVPAQSGQNLTTFSWKINGNDFNCNANISSSCSQPGSNVLFFPVLGNVGEAVNVVATAKNETTGATIGVSKRFVIMAPTVQILSADQTQVRPKILGYYRDANGNPSVPDYSSEVMETQVGNKMVLDAKFYPISKAGQMGFDWSIDGQIQPDMHNKTEITLPVDKPAGDSYTVNLVATYDPNANNNQDYNIRKALFNNWHVTLDDTSEGNDSTSMQINVLDNLPAALAQGPSQSFAASLITHVSEQFMFLLKIVLTSFVLLLTTAIIFAFIPNSFGEDQNRY